LKHGPWGDFTLFAVASREPIPRILPYTLGRGVYNFGGNRYREAIELSHDEERLPDGVDGALELKSPPPMFVAAAMKHMVFNAIEVKELVDTISLVVDPAELRQSLASVRFQIVDADTNDPVAAATATMGGYQTRTAGADGSLTFQHLTPGLLELRADGGKDYAATSRYVLLQPGEFQDVGRILLTKRATISGTVVDTQGKPIACSLAAQPEIASTFPAPLAFGIGYTTKADGRFELPVGRGPHVLLLRSGADDRASMRVDTSRGSVENVRCVLAPGTWVRFQTEGKDDPLFLLEILDSSGTPIQSRYAASGVQPALRLVPGTYNYRTRAFDGSVSNGTFNVRDSEANVVIRM